MEKSINSIQAVGTIEELNFKIETKEVTLKGNGKEKKVTCKQIIKSNWANPNITINSNGNIIGFNFYPTNEKKLDDNGEVVDNPRFKALQTIMEYTKGTRVKVDGSFANNEYVNDAGEFKSLITLYAFTVTSTNVGDEDYCDGSLSGVIKSIKPEMKGEDETGRKIVEFLYLNSSLDVFPINLILDADLVNAFEDRYSKGDSVVLDIECTTRTVGNTKKSDGFGRQSHRVSGYTVTEYKIFSGGNVLEEENKNYLDKSDVKKKLEERDVMIEQKIKDKKSGVKKGFDSASVKKNDEVFVEVEDEDDPFA